MNEPIYRPGDIVKISSIVEVGDKCPTCRFFFVDDMKQYRGDTATIIDRYTYADRGYFYRLNIDNGCRMWSASWLTLMLPVECNLVDIDNLLSLL